jgi:hypothetical protein
MSEPERPSNLTPEERERILGEPPKVNTDKWIIIPQIPQELALKLALILGEIPEVPRLGVHEQQGYRYPRASDINAVTRKVLSKHHVFALWQPVPGFEWREFMSNSKQTAMREVTIWFDLTLIDADSNKSVTVRWPGVAADLITSDKLIAKAETNALKTFLVTQFQIPDDAADNDRIAETEDTRKTGARLQQPNWPKQIRGIVTEVEAKADGWMVTVKGIHYWTRVKAFGEQLRAARGKEVEFSAEIGKGPDNERCPVITKVFGPPHANSTGATPAAAPVSKEEIFK